MAQDNIQQQEQPSVNGMQSSDISNNDHSLVNINRIKDLLPQSGFDGLTELLGMLEETHALWMQEEQSDAEQSKVRAPLLDEVLLLARQHLEQAHCDHIIDNLILGVADICTDANLAEDDLAMLKELLHEDGTEQSEPAISPNSIQSNSNANILEQISQYYAQLNQLTELAESKDLNSIQDILFALKDWFETQYQEDRDGRLFTELDITALEQLTNAVTSYCQQENISDAVQQLFDGIGQLHGEPIIPPEDIEEFSQLLIDETNIQINPENSTPEPQVQENELATEDVVSKVSRTETNVPAHLREFQGMLQLSVEQLEASLTEMLLLIINNNSNLEDNQALGENFENELNKFTGVAGIAGFEGLKKSCEHMQDNYLELTKRNFKLTEDESLYWGDWIEAVTHYLQSPLDQDLIQKLLMVHCAPDWLSALGEEKTAELLISLRELGTTHSETEEPLRQIEATDEDVSLELPDDVYPELLEGLLEELPTLTEEFSKNIQFLNQGGRKEDLTTAQRVAHTIKGAGNTVGIKGIANLTHHLEDILTALADADTLPGKVIMSTLLRACDCLEEMSEVLTNNGTAPADARQVLQEVLDLASRIDRDGVAIDADETITRVIDQPTIEQSNEQSKPAPTAPTAEESTEALIRVPISTIDKLMQFSNEVMIINGQLRERLRQTTGKTRLMQNQLDLIYSLGQELEELVDIRNYDLLKGVADSAASNEFDALEMDQYNELHTCSRRIHEVATDIREMGNSYRKELTDLDNMLLEQGHLNNSSQDDLLTIRMVPVQSVLPRIQRSVRQACRLTGKNVELEITGSEVQMDRDILNGIVDPLMHVLRNAVDHGIESNEQRIAIGKEPDGTIQLHFRNVGNLIEIQCLDDGAGLNLDAIRAKGVDRGIIEADADISDEELKQLIFQPNFSTSENVTQVSGRGVGMDAVSSGIRALGGSLILDSEFGKGCDFKITLPLSLVHYHSLLVKVGKQSVALAERSIEQILHPGAGVLKLDDEQLNFEFENETYPVKTLDALLSRVTPDNSIPLEQRIVLLVQHQMSRYAILAESIVGVTELVVQGMGDLVPNIHGVIGASILDDGSISAVLDAQELLEESTHWSQVNLDQIGTAQNSGQLCALVVDDSLSARRSLEQFVGDLGFEIMAARDGQEAIEMINNRLPDIIITDMEMPRINGIELAEFVRANSKTSQKHLPMIMITSRSTAKHKLLAESKGIDIYLTKPYSEEELTNHIMELVGYTEQPVQAIAG